MNTYLIRKTDGTFVNAEPTVGKWYCGFKRWDQYAELRCGYVGPDNKHGWIDGAIAEYMEGGEFWDEESQCYFENYDFIAEQS